MRVSNLHRLAGFVFFAFVFQGLSFCVAGEEQGELANLKETLKAEEARRLVPLLEQYQKALVSLEKAHTRKGDLDRALEVRMEFNAVEARLDGLRGDKKEESKSVEPKRDFKAIKKGAWRVHTWESKKMVGLVEDWKEISIVGFVEGETNGDVILVGPDHSDVRSLEHAREHGVVVYSWTGRERQFEEGGPVKVRIDQLMKRWGYKPGLYTLYYHATEGDGTFWVGAGQLSSD